jgi:hypothetical protein
MKVGGGNGRWQGAREGDGGWMLSKYIICQHENVIMKLTILLIIIINNKSNRNNSHLMCVSCPQPKKTIIRSMWFDSEILSLEFWVTSNMSDSFLAQQIHMFSHLVSPSYISGRDVINITSFPLPFSLPDCQSHEDKDSAFLTFISPAHALPTHPWIHIYTNNKLYLLH